MPDVAEVVLPEGVLPYTPLPHCVYFLMLRGEVVYVGQTRRLAIRLEWHRKGSRKEKPKEFDQAFYLPVIPGRARAEETRWILKLQPPLNSRCKDSYAHRGRFTHYDDPAFVNAVQEAADKMRWPMALVVRTALEDWLKAHGFALAVEVKLEPQPTGRKPGRPAARPPKPGRKGKEPS